MGVPKFFRWQSQRFPAISQLIAESRIPEFDCLYLDMNGIIHNCTHKDGDSPAFRMTEDAMFIAIFNYIEHLFGKIKPKQLFFMAIDGVAPRAKMNQQRARRFRTALDAEVAREKAIKEGLELPKEAPFDSNCITPGTEFMARLTQQLKYFIHKKISEDSEWQGVEIVLSGHEVPGEGEHKIMEYIRQAKSQPNYDPNLRHCLYGLDADLIMLGLLSHDPHFCLLREEVTFGRGGQKKKAELEHQNFYLMHLCVVREYLELEFQALKQPGVLKFPFDMERVIDDFILMAFFVGNDFLPNLPYLHINEGALALMFQTYKAVLPALDGYINEGGYINLSRLAALLNELSEFETRAFESENSDANWLKSKQKMDQEETGKSKKRGELVMSTQQKELFKEIKKWVNASAHVMPKSRRKPYDLPSSLPARDREFVKTLVERLNLQWSTIEDESGERHLRLSFPGTGDDDDADEDEDEEEESQNALFRVFRQYEKAKTVDVSPEDAQQEMDRKYQEKHKAWKDRYYQSKFGWGLDNEEEMRKLTENYVQGLQWVLFYYYRGVASWPWFFRYHYSPMITDVCKGVGADMNFDLGQPFRPFQQLMGVLPDRSKKIVPEAYWPLMTDPDSPIYDFYPRDFELDMNGKKQEWEAVVKIPFIEEDRLLAAMATKEHMLTKEERARNEFGVTLKFTYSSQQNFTYPSSMPGVFNDIPNCHCIENMFELPTMEGLDVYVGLVEGVKLGKAALAGFPSLKTLDFAAELAFHGVRVFDQESRDQSMIVTLLNSATHTNVESAKKKLGQVVHVGYPFLQEARVTKISDELFDYSLADNGQVFAKDHSQKEIDDWRKKADRIEAHYSKRLGIIVGDIESLVHVELLKGLRKTDNGDTVKVYGHIEGMEHEYASQAIVDEVVSPDGRFIEKAALPIEEEFPMGAKAFFLGEMAFGRPLEVLGEYKGNKLDVWVSMLQSQVDNWARQIVFQAERQTQYTPSFRVAQMLKLNSLALSKLTSSLSVESSGLRLNLGLNLKFESRKQKVLGYSRKGESGWEFTNKAVDLIQQYMVNFPEFIAGLQRNPQGDIYRDTDFYPKEEAAKKMKEIGHWLKSVEAKSLERVPLDANQLDSDVVKVIEEAADQIRAAEGPVQTKKVRAVPRHALLKPADAEQRLGGQKFVVGDRLVYVQDSGKVPIGLTGTVVGTTRTARVTLLDVVMDVPFMAGNTLGDRCSPFRGASVPTTSVLNLTERQVIADTRKTTGARQPQNTPYYTQQGYANAAANGGYGAPSGPGHQGQLFPAQQPPPMAGSFSSAVGGGRGSGNKGYSNAAPPGVPLRGGPNKIRGIMQSSHAAATGRQQQNSNNENAANPSLRTRGGPNKVRGVMQSAQAADSARQNDASQDDAGEDQVNPNFRVRGGPAKFAGVTQSARDAEASRQQASDTGNGGDGGDDGDGNNDGNDDNSANAPPNLPFRVRGGPNKIRGVMQSARDAEAGRQAYAQAQAQQQNPQEQSGSASSPSINPAAKTFTPGGASGSSNGNAKAPYSPSMQVPTQRPNSRGFQVVDLADPIAGVVRHNPNFRPQKMTSVPPPPSLDGSAGKGRGGGGSAKGRTRGRGRGRGRAGVGAAGGGAGGENGSGS